MQSAALRAAQKAGTAPGAVDAAVAAANRAVLIRLMPAQRAVETAYRAALASVADGTDKNAGIAAGEQAAAEVLAQRADDNAAAPEAYRPHTSAGVYVPTTTPAVTQWPQRKPWLMAIPAQFRPGAPTALPSDAWARDYNEAKALGGKASTQRDADVCSYFKANSHKPCHPSVRTSCHLSEKVSMACRPNSRARHGQNRVFQQNRSTRDGRDRQELSFERVHHQRPLPGLTANSQGAAVRAGRKQRVTLELAALDDCNHQTTAVAERGVPRLIAECKVPTWACR